MSHLLTDHPEWGDEVVRNKDQSVKYPIEVNLFFACLLGTISFFGFPLNFEIIIRILCDKTMRLKPRYIIQLGIAFSAILMLSMNVIIILDFIFGPNEFLCHIFVAFFKGVPYNCFLLNYFLYLFDCFIAITFPLWHLTEMTPRRVVYGLIGLNLTMAVAVKLQYISGSLEVRCALQPGHGAVINGTSSVLFILCLIFCCVDFVIAWVHLPRSSSPRNIISAIEMQDFSHLRSVAAPVVAESSVDDQEIGAAAIIVAFTPSSWLVVRTPAPAKATVIQPQVAPRCQRLSVIIEVPEVEEEEEEAVNSNSRTIDDEEITHSTSCTIFSPIEWRATRSFLFGAVPLFLIPLPLFLVYYSWHLKCYYYLNKSSPCEQHMEHCGDLNWLIPYMFFILLSLHALVNPISSLCLNKDFQTPSPISRRLRRRFIRY